MQNIAKTASFRNLSFMVRPPCKVSHGLGKGGKPYGSLKPKRSEIPWIK
jgi:hypothetical protein